MTLTFFYRTSLFNFGNNYNVHVVSIEIKDLEENLNDFLDKKYLI